MKMPDRLETERLIMVPISLKYAKDIFCEFTTELTKYMTPPVPKKISDTETWIDSQIEKNELGIDFGFTILEKESGEFIGCGGVHHIDTRTPELGVWIKKSSHGNGFGREAVQSATTWAVNNLDYDYLKYPVFAENIPSRKIPESLGGVVDHEDIHKNNAGVELKLVEYRIYKSTNLE